MATTGLDRVRQRPLTVIGAATNAGASGPGRERAPEYLRAHGLVDALGGTSRPVRDAGNVTTFVHRPDPENPQAANVEQVREAALSVAAAVSDAYSRGDDVLVLGGDCTIELGTVAGALADDSSVGLIYIDLDRDLNTPATGDGILDWMGLAHILAIDGVEPRLADAGPRTPLLPPQAVYLIAADLLTEPERRVVQQLDIRHEPIAVVRTDLDAVLDRLLTWASYPLRSQPGSRHRCRRAVHPFGLPSSRRRLGLQPLAHRGFRRTTQDPRRSGSMLTRVSCTCRS